MLIALVGWTQDLGSFGIAVFAILSFLSSFIAIPRPILSTVGAIAFGISSILVLVVATTCGACLALLCSRRLFRPWFLRRIANWPSGEAYVKAIDQEGWKVLFLLRLASPVPGFLQNYASGLTAMTVPIFALTTAIGILPGAVVFALLGMAGRSVALQDVQAAWLVAGFLATSLATWIVLQRAKIELRSAKNRILRKN